MSELTQEGRRLTLRSSLPRDKVVVERFVGREAISELFEFHVLLISEDATLQAESLIGRPITVTVAPTNAAPRHFNGVVTNFSHRDFDGNARYSVTMRPRVWFLSRSRDRRIFQNQTVPDIVADVLRAHNIVHELKLGGGYVPRTYCVQYDESPFAFISRLMEDEGIFYFFRHQGDQHVMVLADSPSGHPRNEHASQLFVAPAPALTLDKKAQLLESFEMSQDLAGGEHVLADYDEVTASVTSARRKAAGATPFGRHYHYPGGHANASEGDRKAAVRRAAQEAQEQIGRGSGVCHGLAAGTAVTLSNHAAKALNRDYVLLSVEHEADQRGYFNRFELLPAAIPFRPPTLTPRPRVTGTHTALVTGAEKQEIWADAHGRVKLKFHWDDSPTKGQDTSCWVRVSQGAAGSGYGQWFLPRVGHEVVVSYVEGDPDRPLVVGTVYNKQETLPVKLPANQTQSVIRTRSSKNGDAGNEILLDDRKDAEAFNLRAQKDMGVVVMAALATEVGDGEKHVVKKGDRVVEVQSGKEVHTVKGARDLTVEGAEKHVNKASFTQEVNGDYVLDVKGNCTIKVKGNLNLEVMGAVSIDGKSQVELKAAMALACQGLTIEHKAKTMQTLDGGGLLNVKGGMVKVN